MLSHIFIGITDFERALRFYRPVLASLGIEERFCEPERPWAGWPAWPSSGGRPRLDSISSAMSAGASGLLKK